MQLQEAQAFTSMQENVSVPLLTSSSASWLRCVHHLDGCCRPMWDNTDPVTLHERRQALQNNKASRRACFACIMSLC